MFKIKLVNRFDDDNFWARTPQALPRQGDLICLHDPKTGIATRQFYVDRAAYVEREGTDKPVIIGCFMETPGFEEIWPYDGWTFIGNGVLNDRLFDIMDSPDVKVTP